MNAVVRLVVMVAGLALLLHGTPSWGGPPNPTASDAAGNTAGGTDALKNVVPASVGSTAFGFEALTSNTAGDDNTALGAQALRTSPDGDFNNSNTDSGVNALFSNSTGSLNTANNNVYIGSQGAGDESQTIRIGAAQSATFIAGIGNARVTGAAGDVDTTAGKLGIVPSAAATSRMSSRSAHAARACSS